LTLGVVLYYIIYYILYLYYILYIILYIILYYYILYYTLLLLLLFWSILPILFPSQYPHLFLSSSILLIPILFPTILYLSVLTCAYLYTLQIFPPFLSTSPNILISSSSSQYSRTIRPRTNYRRDVSSGVVLLVCGLCSRFWAGGRWLCFELVLCYYTIILLYYTIILLLLYIILYYYYILYIYYILYYTYYIYIILYSSLPFPSQYPHLFLSFFPHLFLPLLFSSSSNQYLSVLTYTYLYSSSFPEFDPARSIGVDGWGVWCVFVSVYVLTPHVLSEWMVEVWCV